MTCPVPPMHGICNFSCYPGTSANNISAMWHNIGVGRCFDYKGSIEVQKKNPPVNSNVAVVQLMKITTKYCSKVRGAPAPGASCFQCLCTRPCVNKFVSWIVFLGKSGENSFQKHANLWQENLASTIKFEKSGK